MGNIDNKRGHFRHAIEVPILLIDENGVKHEVFTGNVSDCGVYLTVTVEQRPALGSVVQVQVMTPMGDGSPAPVNRAKVMRYDSYGVGLEFILGEE